MENIPQETDLSIKDTIEIIESVLNQEGIDDVPAAKIWAKSTLPELRIAEEKGLPISTNKIILKILEAMVLIERKHGRKEISYYPNGQVETS